MKVSVEISMYALKDDFYPAIDAFLADLAGKPGIEVKTSSISTQVFGDYDAVMELLREAMRRAWTRDGKCAFVTKFLVGDTREATGYA